MESNYEKQVYRARELFLKYDQTAMAEKFELEQDVEYLYVKLLNRTYRIERSSGAVEEQTVGGMEYKICLDYQVVMILYDILCYSEQKPQLSGDWCLLQSMQVTMSSPNPERLYCSVARAFSGHIEELRRACELLGGERQSVPASADVCYKINIFSFFPVIFQFWDGDDEFEPKITVLWDRKSLDFMHFETLYYVMNHLLDALQKRIAE